jgi:hypothetical protein
MILTTEQLAILNHCVLDGQAWFDHAMSLDREDAVHEKINKYKQSYLDEKDKPDYKTCQQKEDEKIQAEQERYDNVSYDVKRSREYASIPDQLDYIYHNGVEKWKTDMILPVKEKYPKGDS